MNRILLTADLHLTDNPMETYRWTFLEETLPFLIRKLEVQKLYVLGDTTDRRDRHAGTLVNRMVATFQSLQALNIKVIIIRGNHDAPLEGGQAYWDFLNRAGIYYIDAPWIDADDDILILPYSHNPIRDWSGLNLTEQKRIFIHQPCDGAVVENGYKLVGSPRLPIFPRSVQVFAGDVHRPQTVGPITYIGAPYPVRFGEDWDNRVILLLEDGAVNSIPVPSIRRAIVNVTPEKPLESFGLKPRDQVRIRVQLSAAALEQWPLEEQKIRQKAEEIGLVMVSVEPLLTGTDTKAADSGVNDVNLEALKPADILRIYAAEEKLSDDVLRTGLELLRKTQ